MTKRLTVFLTFIIVVLVASNLYLALKPPEVVHVVEYVTPPKYPIVIEDFIGREITIYKPPTRIVSCAPSITEIVSALNLTSQIVGLDDFSDFPPIILELKSQGKIASVGGVTTLNIEKIAQLNPDLVLVYAGLQRKFIP
ncbi:MAG TPA: hypothetical protein EYP16_02345 [Candidatus Atribacteria bacterium]|nr:hypothetical protein [Candidatus Atribacteria bacterium]